MGDEAKKVADEAVDAKADVAVLKEVLDGRWIEVRDAARAFELVEYDPPAYELSTEEHRARVLDRLKELAASGIPQIGFPTSSGGQNDIGGGMIAIEMMGYRDLSLMVKAGVQWGLFAGAITALGTEKHHAEHLRPAIDLELLGSFAMTESGHGSDVQALRTTATYLPESEEFEVHTPDPAARKEYIGNAARDGRLAVVFAQLITPGGEHGVHALLVPIRDELGQPKPGVTIADAGRKAGLNGVDNGRLSFDHVRVPRSALLDRYGHVDADGSYSSPIESPNRRFFTMLGTLVRGRVSVAGAALSATKLAQTIAIRRGLRRRQFDRAGGEGEVTLLDYQSHQRRLLPDLAATYALNFAQEELARTLHDLWTAEGERDEHAQRELEARAAGLKAVATWHATSTIQACREACGGAGYMAENVLPQLKADTDVFTTFEGDNTVLLQLVGKGLLTGYRQEFEDLDTIGTVRFVAENVVGVAIERTAARNVIQRLTAGRRDGDAHLRDRAWHLTMLEDREKHLVETLAARLRVRSKQLDDPFRVFNTTQSHLLTAAQAHVERTVLEAFLAGIDRCPDPGTTALLDKLCDLYVLSLLERDRGWYLEHNRITDRRAKDITRTVDELCFELRPHAGDLVDAFAIPDEWITAPIARDDSIS